MLSTTHHDRSIGVVLSYPCTKDDLIEKQINMIEQHVQICTLIKLKITLSNVSLLIIINNETISQKVTQCLYLVLLYQCSSCYVDYFHRCHYHYHQQHFCLQKTIQLLSKKLEQKINTTI